jgi:UDP-N-acetylglucosamine 2-epimerase (non-hydrolysing)
MNILIGYGTRPEFIKVKPLIDKLKGVIDFKTVFTGQHVHIIDKDYQPDYSLLIPEGINRLDSVLMSGLNNDEIFKDITHVLVQGDTSSALSLALAGFHRKVKVIHLEAGLRTYDYDNPYPEEMNRQLIGRIAEIHLCPTDLNKMNLEEERIYNNIHVVGNTGLDNLVGLKNKCEYTNKVLITLHRRENHNIIDKWFTEINNLALKHKDLEFILPIHPNPNVQKWKHILTNVNVVEPLPHNELLDLLVKSKFLISDSGGLQEECSFFNKKIIVCREKTERRESVDYTSFMCKSPEQLKNLFNWVNERYNVDVYEHTPECPFGDGKASEKIVKILKKYKTKI